jgi:uncharacterized protein YdbL (DUF1318 family)
MKILLKTLSIALFLIAFGSSASPLSDLKAKGVVGEQNDGYVGLVKQDSTAAKLIAEVNEKRRQRYQQLAKQNSVPLASIAKLAAEKAKEKTKAGQYIQNAAGKWIKK